MQDVPALEPSSPIFHPLQKQGLKLMSGTSVPPAMPGYVWLSRHAVSSGVGPAAGHDEASQPNQPQSEKPDAPLGLKASPTMLGADPLTLKVSAAEAEARHLLFMSSLICAPIGRLGLYQQSFQLMEGVLMDLETVEDPKALPPGVSLDALKSRVRYLQEHIVALTSSLLGVSGLTDRDIRVMLSKRPELYGVGADEAKAIRRRVAEKVLDSALDSAGSVLHQVRQAQSAATGQVDVRQQGVLSNLLSTQLDRLALLDRFMGFAGSEASEPRLRLTQLNDQLVKAHKSLTFSGSVRPLAGGNPLFQDSALNLTS